MKYGYCRISTPKQSLARQIENINKAHPDAKIYQEIFTGTVSNRKEWNKLKKVVIPGDTIVFDSVSRMSRNSSEGIKDYFEFYDKGINLIFLKEPYINTELYREQLKTNENIKTEDADLNDTIMKGVREYLIILAKRQIQIAFDQSEKEVMDMRQRTKEGLREKKAQGIILGRRTGTVIVTKKEKEFSEKIKKLSKSFGGNFKDKEIIEMFNMRPATYYKYKKNIKIAIENENED